MKVLLLTGGRGSRLTPLTETRPKPLIEICGETLLSRILRFLSEIGLNQIDILTGHHGDKVRQHLAHFPSSDFSFHVVDQQEVTGVGPAVMMNRDRIQETEYFMLIYGDILFSRNMLANLLNTFRSIQKPVAAVCLTNDSRDYGNIYMDHNMMITDIIEKPQRTDLGNYILAGAFILPSCFLRYIEKNDGKIIDAFCDLAREGSFYASIWEGAWVDLGYPWDILTANHIVMGEWTESRIASDVILGDSCIIQGPVVIEPGVVIKYGTNILGPCFIGRNSFIGHSALIRNFTSIGENSVIGFDVEMKNSVLFKNVEIGRLSFIGDSIIGERVNIGSGTVTVNINIDESPIHVEFKGNDFDSGLHKLGALIGDRCWIGAGHTMLPGTKIPPNSRIPHHATLSRIGKPLND